MNEIFKKVIEMVMVVKNLLPVDLNQLAIYMLMFRFFKISRLINNLGEEDMEREIKAVSNSIVAIPAIIISSLYLVAIYTENIINPMYLIGLMIAQDDFGFKIKSANYNKLKKIIWLISVIAISIKIATVIQ